MYDLINRLLNKEIKKDLHFYNRLKFLPAFHTDHQEKTVIKIELPKYPSITSRKPKNGPPNQPNIYFPYNRWTLRHGPICRWKIKEHPSIPLFPIFLPPFFKLSNL